MTIREFLSDRLGGLVFRTVLTLAAAVFLRLTGTEAGIILLLLLAMGICAAGMQGYDFIRQRARLEELEAILEGLDKKYLFAECIPKARGIYERRLTELSARAGRAMIGEVSDVRAAQREYREYVESWVHEIKVPITAAGLICRKAAPDIRERLSQELAQIEAHVERALFYARLESPEKDFLAARVDLEELVAQALNVHRVLLLRSGMRVETENLSQTVYTDRKWVSFMLGQLLQNAVRYRDGEPVLTISASTLGKKVRLTVHDNGIGIPSHELPRVFDRGFTGSNGRTRGGATGMGLYLCRRLADCLEINLQITSEEGKGTTAVLIFPAGSGYGEVKNSNLTKM